MGLMTSLPIIGGMFDNSGQQAIDAIKQNRALLDAIQVPELKWEDYRPELYDTESFNYETIGEDPSLKSMQMSALAKMAGLADTGLSEVDQAGFQKAREMGSQMARGGREAALQDAQNRGVAGSGMEFAMREIGNQEGARRAQDAGLNQAAQSAQQRALYNTAFGNQLGQVRGQDFTANRANTDIINQFNQANTNQRNQTAMGNVDLRNTAQRTNQQGRTDTQQRNFDNQMSRATGQMNANRDMAQGYAAQNAANTAERNQWTQLAAMGGLAAAGMGPWALAGAAATKK